MMYLDTPPKLIQAETFSAMPDHFRRKGEATSVFFDDVPSFRYYPQVYYYRAQILEGLKSKEAGDLYKTFLTIKSKADVGDPMVTEARRRAKVLGVTGF